MVKLFVRKNRNVSFLMVNILLLFTWGFSAYSKVSGGFSVPSWFINQFSSSLLGVFPGVTISYWFVTFLEFLSFVWAVVALFRLEAFKKSNEHKLFFHLLLICSMLNFLALGFGQKMTNQFEGAFQHFVYFSFTFIFLMSLNNEKQNS